MIKKINSTIGYVMDMVKIKKINNKIIMVLSLLLLFTACKSSQQSGNYNCKDCSRIKGGKVCTATGTLENACKAYCYKELILCYQPCPCSDKNIFDRKLDI